MERLGRRLSYIGGSKGKKIPNRPSFFHLNELLQAILLLGFQKTWFHWRICQHLMVFHGCWTSGTPEEAHYCTETPCTIMIQLSCIGVGVSLCVALILFLETSLTFDKMCRNLVCPCFVFPQSRIVTSTIKFLVVQGLGRSLNNVFVSWMFFLRIKYLSQYNWLKWFSL